MKNMTEVKVWRNINFKVQGELPFRDRKGTLKVDGIFKNKSKKFIKDLTNQIIAEVSKQIDWNKPDEILEVPVKWAPEAKVVKF